MYALNLATGRTYMITKSHRRKILLGIYVVTMIVIAAADTLLDRQGVVCPGWNPLTNCSLSAEQLFADAHRQFIKAFVAGASFWLVTLALWAAAWLVVTAVHWFRPSVDVRLAKSNMRDVAISLCWLVPIVMFVVFVFV